MEKKSLSEKFWLRSLAWNHDKPLLQPICRCRFKRAERMFRVQADELAWLLVDVLRSRVEGQLPIGGSQSGKIAALMIRQKALLAEMQRNATSDTEARLWFNFVLYDQLYAAAEAAEIPMHAI